jgi:predicted kinase
MHVIRNERRIRVSRFVGQYATLAGLLTLGIGLVISFVKPDWIVALLVCMVLGIGLSMVGGFFADRYAGPLARHDALTKALKGLDDRYALLHYVLPAAHVLVEAGGCTVFVVKAQGGQVTYDDGRWKHSQRGKFFRQFAGQEAVGLPHIEAEHQVRKLERWLESQQPDTEIPVRAAIVFVDPHVKLDAAGSPVPAFFGKKVKAWLRGPGKLKPLPDAAFRWLEEATGAKAVQGEGE